MVADVFYNLYEEPLGGHFLLILMVFKYSRIEFIDVPVLEISVRLAKSILELRSFTH